jgi:hypothetical protein
MRTDRNADRGRRGPWTPARVSTAGAVLAVAVAGCATRQTIRPQVLAGSFSGQNSEGKAVVVTFTEDDEAFRGEGAIGDDPIVVAGAVGWRGTASLTRASGRQALVELELSADGDRLVLETAGSAPLVLARGGTPAPAVPGPFAGDYRARKERATLAEVSLVQRGSLLAGVAVVAGDAAGISGRVVESRRASGFVTFADGTQVPFDAELAADGRTLQVNGFGHLLVLDRRRAP